MKLTPVLIAFLFFFQYSYLWSTRGETDNIQAAPVIDNISKIIFSDGESLRINGKNFGSERGNSLVSFNGINAEIYIQWTDVSIVLYVPEGIISGKIYVWVDGVQSNGISYTYQKKFKLMETVLIKAGTFIMGSDDSTGFDNKPKHSVTISRDFEMSIKEVSQLDFKKVMDGANPSHFTDTGDYKPVQQVTFLRALEFCNRLSDMENFSRVYTISGNNVSMDIHSIGYRLPTEAEWEYAARCGRDSNYTADEIKEMSWVSENAEGHSKPVGTRKPNAWGIYDMFGNVNEWCWDLYDADYYSVSSQVDPLGPASSSFIDRIVRGGSFVNGADMCNSDKRSSFPGSDVDYLYNIGFRIVRNKVPSDVKENDVNEIIIFPNPAHEIIESSCLEGVVRIYDIFGKCVIDRFVNKNDRIDIIGLPTGLYYLINNGISQKFIKV